MKNKFQMLKELLESGITKEQIRTKNFNKTRFKINFYNWNLSLFDFRSANFSEANFSDANFSEANFSDANFRSANFSDANFSEANFSDANFSEANFSDANFRSADLNLTLSEGTFGLTINCPEKGSFICFKKIKRHNLIVVLEVQSDALRSSATSYKCRASKTKTIAIENLDGSLSELTKIESDYDPYFIYEIGVINEVSDFDKDRWNECAEGIHFFLSRKMAECYN